jgi:excisionase family DNA binding protein
MLHLDNGRGGELMEAQNPEPQVVTVVEAGRLVGLGRSAAYDAVRRGELPSIRFGRRLVVPLSALRRLLDGEPQSV